MMKRFAILAILLYYVLGTLLLPEGNFAALPALPDMYAHCKQHEDKDMNWMDFIKDHLVNIDCIFDPHEDGDDQKPHQPYDFSNQNSIQLFVFKTFESEVAHFSGIILTKVFHWVDFKRQEFHPGIFKPPKF